jgi:hypothetical protein
MAINGNQWKSMEIKSHQRTSISTPQLSSNRWPSMAIDGNQWKSMEIKSHQRTSISTPRRIGAEPNACATSAAWSANGRIPQAGGWASLSLGPLCLATTSASAASN